MGLFNGITQGQLASGGLTDYEKEYMNAYTSSIGQQNMASNNVAIGMNALHAGGGGGYANTATGMNMLMAQQSMMAQQAAQVTPPKVDLDKDAGWSATVSQLVDMWLAKFGSSWVTNLDAHSDPFYSTAVQRLMKIGKLESHFINGSDVYRLVE